MDDAAQGRSSGCIPNNIYIYNGYGVSEKSREMLFHFLKSFVDVEKFSVAFISPEDILEGEWTANCALLAFGGGFDRGFVKSLGQDGMKSIKDYVESGGSFLGICAGAYFGCDRIEFDKSGPLEVCEDRDLKFFPGLCVGPVFPGFRYDSEYGSKAAPIVTKDTDGVTELRVYFNGGGYFIRDNKTSHGAANCDSITELAFYQEALDSREFEYCCASESSTRTDETINPESHKVVDLKLKPAIVLCQIGKGIALLSGVHFEYDPFMMNSSEKYLKPVVDELTICEPKRHKFAKKLLKYLRVL